MQVSNILSGITDATSVLKRVQSAVTGTSAATAGGETAAAKKSAAIRQILSEYDVTDISPADFSKMVQELYTAGAISKKDLEDLSSIRAEVEKSGVQPDEAVNLLEAYRTRVQQAQREADADPSSAQAEQIGALTHQLGWLEKFSAVHAQPDSAMISTLA